MIILSTLVPVTSEEMVLDKSYIILSSAEQQIYILSDSDKKFVKLFGRPSNYSLFSCTIDMHSYLTVDDTTTFSECECPGLYKHVEKRGIEGDLAIIWD